MSQTTLTDDLLGALPAPRVTAAMIELATMLPGAVVIQDGDGATYALERLSSAQADDPNIVVLVDHSAALAFVDAAAGRPAAAAKLVTALFAAQHARGLL
jgi:hypothetical protein